LYFVLTWYEYRLDALKGPRDSLLDSPIQATLNKPHDVSILLAVLKEQKTKLISDGISA